MNIYYRYKCNTCCIPVLSLDGRRKSSAQQTKKKQKSLVSSYLHVRSIEAYNFGALISFCSILIVFFPFLLFANYIEQLFGASAGLGETPLFFFSFLASEKKIHRSFIHDSNGNFCCCAQFTAIQFNGNESAIVQKTR